MSDKTRIHDLNQLAEERTRAKNSYERDLIDKTVDKIMRESGAVRERREKLLMAIRNDDRKAIQRFQHDLMMMRADETYGKQY